MTQDTIFIHFRTVDWIVDDPNHHGLLMVGLILGMIDDDSVPGGFSSQNINISSH